MKHPRTLTNHVLHSPALSKLTATFKHKHSRTIKPPGKDHANTSEQPKATSPTSGNAILVLTQKNVRR